MHPHTMPREHDEVPRGDSTSLSEEYPTVLRAQEQRSAAKSTEWIWLAEDNPDVRRSTTQILTCLGYQVLAFGSGAELLATVEWWTQPFDLLLTDFEMPGLTGYELASQLRALMPHLKVLLTSGLPEEEIVPSVMPTDWPQFIAKPFTGKSLGHKLREILEAPTMSR